MQGQPVEKSKRVWEKPIQRDETHFAESDKMTYIPATILAVEKQLGRPGRHRVFVRILLRKYRGSFNALKFGENKPLMGVLSKRTTRPYLLPRSQPQSGAVIPVVDDSVNYATLADFSGFQPYPTLWVQMNRNGCFVVLPKLSSRAWEIKPACATSVMAYAGYFRGYGNWPVSFT
jgi:hypothetical protein